jgi:prepilin-type processing-associated H-X9-DG protein
MPTPVRCRAFSMVEMLVSFTIVATLTAALLPAAQSARQSARTSFCGANEREIATGFGNYAIDHMDLIPPVGSTYLEYWGGPDPAWHQNLGRAGYFGPADHFKGAIFGWYNNRYPVFRCPQETGGNYDPAYPKATYYDSELVCSSYIMNWDVSEYGYGIWYNGKNDYRLGWYTGSPNYRPSEARIVTDVPDYGIGWALPYYEWNIDNTSPAYLTYYAYAFRHNNNSKANFLYMDGHVTPRGHFAVTGDPNWQTLWGTEPYQ